MHQPRGPHERGRFGNHARSFLSSHLACAPQEGQSGRTAGETARVSDPTWPHSAAQSSTKNRGSDQGELKSISDAARRGVLDVQNPARKVRFRLGRSVQDQRPHRNHAASGYNANDARRIGGTLLNLLVGQNPKRCVYGITRSGPFVSIESSTTHAKQQRGWLGKKHSERFRIRVGG